MDLSLNRTKNGQNTKSWLSWILSVLSANINLPLSRRCWRSQSWYVVLLQKAAWKVELTFWPALCGSKIATSFAWMCVTYLMWEPDVYFKSLPRGLTFLFDRLVKFMFFMAKTVFLSSKQVMKLIFMLFGYYYQFDNNKLLDFKLLKCHFDFNKFVYCETIFSCQGNFRNL